MNTLIRFVGYFWSFVAPFMGLLPSALVLIGLGVQLPVGLAALNSQLQTAVASIPNANIGQYYSLANAVFPLTELFGMLAFLLGLHVVAAAIRLLKGIIPGYG